MNWCYGRQLASWAAQRVTPVRYRQRRPSPSWLACVMLALIISLLFQDVMICWVGESREIKVSKAATHCGRVWWDNTCLAFASRPRGTHRGCHGTESCGGGEVSVAWLLSLNLSATGGRLAKLRKICVQNFSIRLFSHFPHGKWCESTFLQDSKMKRTYTVSYSCYESRWIAFLPQLCPLLSLKHKLCLQI